MSNALLSVMARSPSGNLRKSPEGSGEGPILPDLARFDRVALDTETTGTGYNDRAAGISWALPDGSAGYARWGHECGGNNVDKGRALDWLRRECNRPDLTVYFHNAGFDLRMLAYDMGHAHPIPRAKVEDTGFMAALLNELEPSFSLDELGEKHLGERKAGDELYRWCAETFGGSATRKAQAENIWRAPGDLVEEYAEQDARLTLGLADLLRPRIWEEGIAEVYHLETSLIPILLKMHMVGVHVDVEQVLQVRTRLEKMHAELQEKFFKEVGREVNYNSTGQLVELWEELGIPYRRRPPTEKMLAKGIKVGNPSITKDDLEHLDHPVGMQVRKLRQVDHYRGTFIQSYILDNVGPDGRIHGEFHPLQQDFGYGTISGRFSSGGALNLQNIPSRDEFWAPIIRGLYTPARKGDVWLKADYSQIEFRFLAHYAGGQLRRAYLENPDIDFHELASEIVGIPRGDAKHINFGFVYGMGVKKLALQLGKTLAEAQVILDDYHSRLPEVRRLYKKADRLANRRGFIRTWGGRIRRFEPEGHGHKFTYRALNALLQGSAADLIKKAMVALDEVLDWEETPLHLTVHDELDFSVPRGRAREFGAQVREIMEDFQVSLPVRADIEYGDDWGHVSEDYFKEAA